jgi:hypothetical protein
MDGNDKIIPKLQYHSVNSGFCRVYYKLEPSGTMFCFQNEGNGKTVFYICNNLELEPEYPFPIKKDLQIEINLIPITEHAWDRELCYQVDIYIKNHKNFKVVT